MDAASEKYVSRVAVVMVRVLDSALTGVYLHGSAVLGGFDARRSDIDVLVVCRRPMTTAEQSAAAELLSEKHLPCPARGLELSVVTETVTQHPTAEPDFELHLTTAPEDTKVVDGHQHSGDPDLVLHFAVARAAGHLVGPGRPAAEIFAVVPNDLVVARLVTELSWGAEHAPGEYAVLNACRAWRFAADGMLVSKVAGGAWALGRSADADRELIQAALDRQRSQPVGDLDRTAVQRFVQAALCQLTGGARR